MGYYEVHCQLCGVSFNINRIRTRDEPRIAAWGCTLIDKHVGWRWVTAYSHGYVEQKGCIDGGCSLVHRGPRDGDTGIWQHPEKTRQLYEDDPEDGIRAEDPTYECGSDSEDEPLEYDSNAEDEQDGSADVSAMETDEQEQETSEPTELDLEPEWSFSANGPPPKEFDAEFFPLSTAYIEEDGEDSRPFLAAYHRAEEFEHIAGTNCQNPQGYHGDRISVEEMMDCCTVQCLVMKSEEWKPRKDDMDFEKESKVQLTGLADHMPSGGWGLKFAPVRNGVDRGEADNEDNAWVDDMAAEEPKALPFHTACFEIFRKISQRLVGKIDADGLMELRNGGYKRYIDVNSFERHQDVQDASEQVWQCYIGAEYLAANPIFIPGFRAMCEAAISSDVGFDIRQSPFPERKRQRELLVAGDPFLKLPPELKQTIVWNLESPDIAALRLASHAFEHLPIALWHRLMERELPWVYEAWCDEVEPYHWAMANASDLIQVREQEEQYALERNWKRNELEDNEPESIATWEEIYPKSPPWHHNPEFKARLRDPWEEKMKMGPIKPPRHKTNWYQLYRDITVNKEKLKGLRNRERIWANVWNMVEEIKRGQEGMAEDSDMKMEEDD